MAAFLVRALNLSASGPEFTDTGGHVFEEDISKLAEAGITRGCNPPENTRFCPDESVTRGEMAAFLVRALDLTASGPEFTDTGNSVFKEDISKLAEAGITRGCNPPDNTRFCPDESVSRGQMAAFLRRALQDDTNPPPPPGDKGIIYGHWDGLGGEAYRYDLDADNPQWEEFLGGRTEHSDVVASTSEWVGAGEGAWIEENPVTFYDLDTQTENQTVIWPESGDDPERMIKIEGLAVSNDGQLLAGIVTEGTADPQLEVVNRSNSRIIGGGFDTNTGIPGVTAMEWTNNRDLIIAGTGLDDNQNEVPVIGVVPADKINGDQPYEQVGKVYIALTNTGAGAVQWVALSQDGSQIAFVERGNIWVAEFHPGAKPHQLTTGFWAGGGDPGWTAQFSPDESQLAVANQIHQQFIIPNHRSQPINLELAENEEKYQVGDTLVNYINAWLP
ncbi:MAG: hypothetical protein GEU79_09835 [Acidimicrobiia bacterium]|nr:hypothetical protein [Acidimicrobiia bacterium]